MAWGLFCHTGWKTTLNNQLHLPRDHCPQLKNYFQLDKDALAIVFGVKKFHQYVYGRHFTILTDHKPLEWVLHPDKITPPMAAARIQRWALILSAYDYVIQYKEGIQETISFLEYVHYQILL
jgi:hypothetical protein